MGTGRVGVLAGLLLSCPVLGRVGLAPPPLAPAPRTPVAELIRQLGSDDFQQREWATEQLASLPLAEPPPELIRASRSENPEVSRRAAQAIRMIRLRAENRALGRQRVFAKYAAVDRFIASTATWDLPADDERVWQTVLELATTLADRARFRWRVAGGRGSLTAVDFWVSCPGRVFIRSDEPHRLPDRNAAGKTAYSWPGGVEAPEVVAPHGLYRNLVVARGPVQVRTSIDGSVILANGNLTAGDSVDSAIVFSDGDIEVNGNVDGCIVIARGNIRVGGSVVNSTVIAGGRVTVGKLIRPGEREQIVIEDNVRMPLGISFFELSTAGVEARLADTAVKVTAVADGKPFARAGVRVGDVVTAVNGKKPDSVESLRRLLRDALAVGDAMLTLRRGDRTETVKVTLPE